MMKTRQLIDRPPTHILYCNTINSKGGKGEALSMSQNYDIREADGSGRCIAQIVRESLRDRFLAQACGAVVYSSILMPEKR